MQISYYRLLASVLTAFWIGVLITVVILNNISDNGVCTGVDCAKSKPQIKIDDETKEQILEQDDLTDAATAEKRKTLEQPQPKLVTRSTKGHGPKLGLKKVIYLYGSNTWNKYDYNFDWRRCQPHQSKCIITTDNTRIPESDAIVYNSIKMPPDNVIAKHKHMNFKRVFLSGETPLNAVFNINKFDDFFDYSVTYKSESDIRIPYWPNDGILPAMYRSKTSSKVLEGEDILDLEDEVKEYFKRYGKEYFLTYTIKNCTSGLYRNLFVGKLREEGNIDIYSTKDDDECLKIIRETSLLPCKGFNSDYCVKHFEKYKFIILPDEHLCTDYTSRDYWQAILAWNAVPLLYGAGDYKKHLIPNSYIDCVGNEDYISPSFKKAYGHSQKSLDYYKTYQLWRHEDRIETYYWQCELCERLSNFQNPKEKLKMSLFWNKEKNCGSNLEVNEKMRLQLVRTGVIK